MPVPTGEETSNDAVAACTEPIVIILQDFLECTKTNQCGMCPAKIVFLVFLLNEYTFCH